MPNRVHISSCYHTLFFFFSQNLYVAFGTLPFQKKKIKTLPLWFPQKLDKRSPRAGSDVLRTGPSRAVPSPLPKRNQRNARLPPTLPSSRARGRLPLPSLTRAPPTFANRHGASRLNLLALSPHNPSPRLLHLHHASGARSLRVAGGGSSSSHRAISLSR